MIIMMILTFQLHNFHKISFHYFWGLFNDETDLRVRYGQYKFKCGPNWASWAPTVSLKLRMNWEVGIKSITKEKNRDQTGFSHMNWSSGEFHPQFFGFGFKCAFISCSHFLYWNQNKIQQSLLNWCPVLWTSTQFCSFHGDTQIGDETRIRATNYGPKMEWQYR